MEVQTSWSHALDDEHLTVRSVDLDIRWDSTESNLAEVSLKITVDVKPNRRLKVLRIADTGEESVALVRCNVKPTDAGRDVVPGRQTAADKDEDELAESSRRRRLHNEVLKQVDMEASEVFEEVITGLKDLCLPALDAMVDGAEIEAVDAGGNGGAGNLTQTFIHSPEKGKSISAADVAPTGKEPTNPAAQNSFAASRSSVHTSPSTAPTLPYCVKTSAALQSTASNTPSPPLTPLANNLHNDKTTSGRGSGRVKLSVGTNRFSGSPKVKIPWQSVSREDMLEYERRSPTKRHSTHRDPPKSPSKQTPAKPFSSPATASSPRQRAQNQTPMKDMSVLAKLARQENRLALSLVPELRRRPEKGTTGRALDYVGAQDVHDLHVPRRLSDALDEKFSTDPLGGSQPIPESWFASLGAVIPGSTIATAGGGCLNSVEGGSDADADLLRTPALRRRQQQPSGSSSDFEISPRDSSLLAVTGLGGNKGLWRKGLEPAPVLDGEEDEDVAPLFINSRGLAFVYFPYGSAERELELYFTACLRVAKPGEGYWRKFELSGLPKTADGYVNVTVLIVHPAGDRLNVEYDATNCLAEGTRLQLMADGLHGRFTNVDPLVLFFRQEQWSVLLESVDIEVNVICTFSLNKDSRTLQVCYDAFIQLLGRNTDVFAQEAVVELEILNCPARGDAAVLVSDFAGRSILLGEWSAATRSRDAILTTTSADLAEPFELCITIEKADLTTSFFQLPVILPKSAKSRLVSERLTICEPDFPIQADFSTHQLFRGWQHRCWEKGSLVLHEFSRRPLPSVRPTGLLLQARVVHITPPRGYFRPLINLPDIAHFAVRGRKAEERLVAVECELHIESHSQKNALLAHIYVPQTGEAWHSSHPIVNGSLASPEQICFDSNTGELRILRNPQGTTEGATASVSLFWWTSILDRDPVFLESLNQPKLGLQIALPCLVGDSRRRCRSYVFSDLESAILQWWSKASPTSEKADGSPKEVFHARIQKLKEGETFAVDGICDGMSIVIPEWHIESLESTVLESCSPSCQSVAETLDLYEHEDGKLDLELEGLSCFDDGTFGLEFDMADRSIFAEGDGREDNEGKAFSFTKTPPSIKRRADSSPRLQQDWISSTPSSIKQIKADTGAEDQKSITVRSAIIDTTVPTDSETIVKRRANIDGILEGVLVFWSVLAAACLGLLIAGTNSSRWIGLGDYYAYPFSPPFGSLIGPQYHPSFQFPFTLPYLEEKGRQSSIEQPEVESLELIATVINFVTILSPLPVDTIQKETFDRAKGNELWRQMGDDEYYGEADASTLSSSSLDSNSVLKTEAMESTNTTKMTKTSPTTGLAKLYGIVLWL